MVWNMDLWTKRTDDEQNLTNYCIYLIFIYLLNKHKNRKTMYAKMSGLKWLEGARSALEALDFCSSGAIGRSGIGELKTGW